MNKPRHFISTLFVQVLCFSFLLLRSSWASAAGAVSVRPSASTSTSLPGLADESSSPFNEFLRTDIPPADGFDFPVGDPDGWGSYKDPESDRIMTGWSVYIRFCQRYKYGIHPGEDWNGDGLGNSDLGQAVYSVANGKVVLAKEIEPAGGVIIIEHVFYENHSKHHIQSVYKHLQNMRVKKGQTVRRREIIGYIGRGTDDRYTAHLHLEMRWDSSLSPGYWPSAHSRSKKWIQQHYASPSAFIRGHRHLFIPSQEPHLALIHIASEKIRLYDHGRVSGEYAMGYGWPSADGIKTHHRGPRRGMYFVVRTYRPKIGGDFGQHHDSYGIQINYPNPYDAARAEKLGLVLSSQRAWITHQWFERRSTTGKYLLNRGFAFRGLIQEWDPNREKKQYWGSLLMRPGDIRQAMDHMPEGTMVVIF